MNSWTGGSAQVPPDYRNNCHTFQMESKPLHMKRHLTIITASLLLAFAAHVNADPVADLAAFSVFDKIDLAQLASGDAKTMRGPAMSTPRFLSVQSVWVAPGSPSQVSEALRRWNPAQHSELNIIMHANGSDFARLQQAPNNSAVGALVSATVGKSNDLQLSRAEGAKLPTSGNGMAGPVAGFWSGVLSARAAAGPFGQPPYENGEQPIRAGDEINRMLQQQPKIQKQFSGLIGGKGEQYWELNEIESKGVLTLGASYNRSGGNSSAQAADVIYYASGGFYAAATLYQMWPVDVGGKPSTLVWRGDMTSSAELGDARGIERLGSESALIKDVSRAVRLFRRDTGATP
ncbi:MAG: hypothetical protein ABR526_13515 [Chthoniobacterales bacterium]